MTSNCVIVSEEVHLDELQLL